MNRKKKRKSFEGMGKTEKKAKDFSKGKACMSQAVMDAIVKSIEETVSRVRREDEEKEENVSLLKGEEVSGPNLRVNKNGSTGPLQSNSFGCFQRHAKGTGDDRDQRAAPPSGRGNKSSKSAKRSAGASPWVNQKHAEELHQSRDNSITIDCPFDGAGVDLVLVKEAGAELGDKSGSKRGKRFRKRTRKAEEALGVQDIFWDCDWPVKKAKTKKR